MLCFDTFDKRHLPIHVNLSIFSGIRSFPILFAKNGKRSVPFLLTWIGPRSFPVPFQSSDVLKTFPKSFQNTANVPLLFRKKSNGALPFTLGSAYATQFFHTLLISQNWPSIFSKSFSVLCDLLEVFENRRRRWNLNVILWQTGMLQDNIENV